MNLSTSVRDAMAGQIETTVGASAKLLIFSGAKPNACADADPTGLLASLDLPSDWLTVATSGAVSKNGTWSGTGSANGTAESWRIKNSAGTTCHMQGSAGGQGSGMELILDNANIALNQSVTISSFSFTMGQASG